jgi:hypothetical protein
MRKFKPEIVLVRRLRDGPRRARGRVGMRVVLFFLATAILTGALAITLNLSLEDTMTFLFQRMQSSEEFGKPQ